MHDKIRNRLRSEDMIRTHLGSEAVIQIYLRSNFVSLGGMRDMQGGLKSNFLLFYPMKFTMIFTNILR
jgi:hypothetical protein